MEKLNYAKFIVRETGELIKKQMENALDIDTKMNEHDFVTNVDKQAEQHLINDINAKYEHQDFVTEEKMVATQGGDQVWIIDPIDGTTNFIFQKRNFAISVAYYENKKPVFGIVYDVMADNMYYAYAGEGAWVDDVKLLPLDTEKELKDAIVNADNRTLKTFKVDMDDTFMVQRYMGSAALEIVEVAMGRSQSYISRRLKPWDVAAAVIILKEVGGTWSFGDVRDGIFFEDEHGYFLSGSNTKIYDALKSYQ